MQMEVGTHIKSHRDTLGLSQEALAERIYVSRQTISSWENGKTYPDIQSLLLLSEVFDVTVDDLIKGDVDAMTATIDNDVKTVKLLSCVMIVGIVLIIACMIWYSFQMVVWDWSAAQGVPTIVLAVTIWIIVMAAAIAIEHIKKAHDLVTFQEILAFWEGREPNRATEKGVQAREKLNALSCRSKIARAVLITIVAAAIGAIVGFCGSATFNSLLG